MAAAAMMPFSVDSAFMRANLPSDNRIACGGACVSFMMFSFYPPDGARASKVCFYVFYFRLTSVPAASYTVPTDLASGGMP
jgi:hypothetical protein